MVQIAILERKSSLGLTQFSWFLLRESADFWSNAACLQRVISRPGQSAGSAADAGAWPNGIHWHC